jgi:hypothetical protein
MAGQITIQELDSTLVTQRLVPTGGDTTKVVSFDGSGNPALVTNAASADVLRKLRVGGLV